MASGDPLSLACDLWWCAPLMGIAVACLAAAAWEPRGAHHEARPRLAATLGAVAALSCALGGAVLACGCVVKAGVAFTVAAWASAGAVWFVRGAGQDDTGGDGDGGIRLIPPAPSGPSGDAIDWEAFERDFAAYAARTSERVPA